MEVGSGIAGSSNSAMIVGCDNAVIHHSPSHALPRVQSRRRRATQDGARGLIVLSSPRIYTQKYRPVVADAAMRNRLPAIGLLSSFPRDGLLMAYGPVQRDMLRSAATLIAKILDGARPADLPIERPVHFELVINLKTAKALGITIPQSVLVRADEVIQ